MSFLWDWISGMLNYLGLYKKSGKLLFLGLDNAGKTTLLHMLKDERMGQHVPTLHGTSEELTMGGMRFTTYDLGGHRQARRVWKQYFPAVDGIVFLIDVADSERFPESINELQVGPILLWIWIGGHPQAIHWRKPAQKHCTRPFNNIPELKSKYKERTTPLKDSLLGDEQIGDCPLLILGNKIDKAGAASEEVLRYNFGLNGRTTGRGNIPQSELTCRPCELFMCSILKRQGYGEGFRWLAQYLR